jgi:WD40 repeat protein
VICANVVKWSLQFSISTESSIDSHPILSWGPSEELLVGHSDLKLYHTSESEALIWHRDLSSPAALVALSPDGSLIASAAKYDRLVKIWRRRSYGDGDLQFDYSYLPHPATVTSFHWRERHGEEHGVEYVLYTICSDSKVRIWASLNPHGLQALQLWSEIDLQSSIQPRNGDLSLLKHARYVIFIEASDFVAAVETATSTQEPSPILDHLTEIAKTQPDLCMIFDMYGNLCVWGIQNIKDQPSDGSDTFNMIYVEDVAVLNQRNNINELPIKVIGFNTTNSAALHSIILHSSDGCIHWYEGSMLDILDPTRKVQRYSHKALLTGHESSIKKINRTNKGRAIISRTADNESIVWKQAEEEDQVALTRKSNVKTRQAVKRSCLLGGGDYVANLHIDSISLWDTRNTMAKEITSLPYQLSGNPLCLISLPLLGTSHEHRYLVTISSKMTGIVWRITIPGRDETNKFPKHLTPTFGQFCTFDLGTQADLAYVIPIDPAGSNPVASGFLDTFAKDVALSYTTKGTLCTWAAKIDPDKNRVDWLATATVNTGILNPSLASGSSIRKVAVVNSEHNGLSIWDTRGAQLEYEKQFQFGENIQDLDWTSTPDDQSILAVGFPHKVMVLAQIRYDYLDRKPAWAPIREIYIRESTPHPIGDSTWLGSGSLVIGAGNQLFVYDKFISFNDENVRDLTISTRGHTRVDIFDVVSLLNGPLPVYHPQLLSQCILSGKMHLVQKIIINLNEALKFYSEGDTWDASLSIKLEEFYEEEVIYTNYLFRLPLIMIDTNVEVQDTALWH